jgi:long-chain fatty acid transport protein
MKKVANLALTVMLVACFSTSTFANGLSLNSVGTRALGMGGAFVALSNDATAIYWNPAGLVGQESSVLAYFTGVMPIGTYQFAPVGIDAKMESKLYPTGGLIGNYKDGNWAFALGVYVPAGLGASWNLEDFGVPASMAANLELMSQIGAIVISPAVAYQVDDKLSVGLAINVTYAMFDMKQHASGAALGLGIYQFEESSTGIGVGATLGLKYKFNEKVAAGLTARLASKVPMSGTAMNPLFPALPTIPGMVQPGPGESDFDRDVTWPIWIAGGIAFKPHDCLTITVDAQFSQWSELDKLVAVYNDPYWKAAMGAQGQDEFHLNWEDRVQVRLGGEYMVSPNTAIRLGYYYDPAPAPDETLNILFPSSTNHVGTAGFGYNFGKYTIEASAEYLFGADRNVIPAVNGDFPGTHHLDVFAFSVGFGMEL